MLTRTEQATPSQNIGLIDRVLRFTIGAVMLAGGAYFVSKAGDWRTFTTIEHAMLIVMLLSIYPLLTAVLGVDPVFSATGIRSGGSTGRNQCGTFPYQIMAALGKAPRYSESGDEHSLEDCHDEPIEHPHHLYWRVDKDPMVYPDDATMEEFARRERKKMKLASK